MGRSQFNRKKKSSWVSASDVGRTVFCPHSVALKHQGAKPSQQAIVARQRGEQRHEVLNQKAREDKRCYVASYLYGVDDPRTNMLRKFRDQSITKWPGGRFLVRAYYRVSPTVIQLSEMSPWVKACVHYLVNHLTYWYSRKDSKP